MKTQGQIKRAAVLGSGVMGSAIAAHLANAGVPSLVLDIVPRELTDAEKRAGLDLDTPRVRNRIAADSIKGLKKMKPAPLFSPARFGLIEVGNFEDDLARIAEADWVIEVVKEEMKIKRKVLSGAAEHLGPNAILTSNTSGLSLQEMAECLPENMRSRFLGTHFFNPPRYMRLLETIETQYTDAGVTEALAEFARTRLGKGIVPAKDTPNFIANRIGVHAMMVTLRAMQEEGLSVEEIDAITGPPLGRPRSGTFRLADMVGLDTLLLVAENVRRSAENDESADVFAAPEFLTRMVDAGLLGSKSGAGFYRKVKKPEKGILTLDLETLEHRRRRDPELPELAALKKLDGTEARIAALIGGEGRGAKAAWKILAATLSYSAMRLGEIADRADAIDTAMKLGFNWSLGPFETWDALGFRKTTERLRADGFALPAWVEARYEAGATSIYEEREGARHAPTGTAGATMPVPADPRTTDFDALRRNGRELKRNDSAGLIDLGDGVLGLEFHSKMNTVDQGTIDMIVAAADTAEAEFDALVVANGADNFCAGANLMLILQHAQEKDFEAVNGVIAGFQNACSRLEYCGVPVVTAPQGLALGGGCEIVMAGNSIRAAAEAYIGLVEIGAGLVPAGGGCMRLYRRNLRGSTDPAAAYDAVKRTFETIGKATVSGSAEEAQGLGFLRPDDSWSMNLEHRVHDAKRLALALAGAGYVAPNPGRLLPVMGRSGKALVDSGIVNMLDGKFITEHEATIGRELASILTGGGISGPTLASEQHILDLERESFLRLCGEPKTLERMLALLKTGKPLRN